MPHTRLAEVGAGIRHNPTLYAHPEDGAEEDDLFDDGTGDTPRVATSTNSYRASRNSYTMTPGTATKTRSKQRPGAPSASTPARLPSARNSRYSNVYAQFNQKYRTRGTEFDENSHELDKHYFSRVPGKEDSDSDDETGHRRASAGTLPSDGPRFGENTAATIDDSESWPVELQTEEDKERMEWQTMLASVLDGEVLRSEKTRIGRAMESYESQRINRLDLWYGLRAKLRGRGEEYEKQQLVERRRRIVPPLIDELLQFRIPDASSSGESIPQPHNPVESALKQVAMLLLRLDVAEGLYPNLKALRQDHPSAATDEFSSRVDTLNSWYTVVTAVRNQIGNLRKWTGSETLDIALPNQPEVVTILPPRRPSASALDTEHLDANTFVERILKEDGLQRTFEKGALVDIHGLVQNARTLFLDHADVLHDLNLPSFSNDLVLLIGFPTRLMEEVLRVRLDYATKLTDPNLLSIDQMLEDFRLAIGLACTLKSEYDEFMKPDLEEKWNIPSCIGEDYEGAILDSLRFFFKLIHQKLKSGNKGIYFKETELLEAQWGIMEEVTMATSGGGTLVAEHVCSLAHKLMIRVITAFQHQVRVPTGPNGSRSSPTRPKFHADGNVVTGDQLMSPEEAIRWYTKVLDGVRLRHRKLHRYSRLLVNRFGNSAEFSLDGVHMESFIATLIETGHFLIYTEVYEAKGLYLIGDPSLYDQPEVLRQMVSKAFHVVRRRPDLGDEFASDDGTDEYDLEADDGQYLLVLSPIDQFVWGGTVLMLGMPPVELDLKESRARLISTSPLRLKAAKERFQDYAFLHSNGEEEIVAPLRCLVEQQAHLSPVNRELRKIERATNRLAEVIVDSINEVHPLLKRTPGSQELMESWFTFASEHGESALKQMDPMMAGKLSGLLTKLSIVWVAFICDNCDPTDRKTFRWAVNALEFALVRTRGANILQLPQEDYNLLQQKVASCMTLLISHFDILGARSSFEAQKEEERLAGLRMHQSMTSSTTMDDDIRPSSHDGGEMYITKAPPDRTIRIFHDRVVRGIVEVDQHREAILQEQHLAGRVLEDESPDDRSLVFLASQSNISIRWQQGRFLGAGAFGSVYMAMNLDTGGVMAAKEIRFKDSSSLNSLYKQVRDELAVMELLHHPNIVEYYGIEVHRDKVYIFEEYCSGGTLAQLLDHGRIEDESVTKVYTMQMLEGLMYLHSQNVVHRDIKPDNILLDHNGIIKYVDFGAAKVLAKNQRTVNIQKSVVFNTNPQAAGLPGLDMNSLTGTPMYMSPEIIKNDKRGRRGAMDIWSLGCVVLECATGRKPWSNLDNEWAIMFHIGVATQHPPLPEPGQLSDMGIRFIKQCLNIDPMRRPSAEELYEQDWMVTFREELAEYENEHYVSSTPSLTHTSLRSDAFDSLQHHNQPAQYTHATKEPDPSVMLSPWSMHSPTESDIPDRL